MMTEEFYYVENYEIDHSTFGGSIFNGDFDAHYSLADITERILSDMKFDEQCRKNAESRARRINYKKGIR